MKRKPNKPHSTEPNNQPNKQPKKLDVHPIIRQIINRDCHVAWSNRQVILHVVSKLREGSKTFHSMPRTDRRQFIEQCIQQHRENRELYRAVMFPTYRNSDEESGS